VPSAYRGLLVLGLGGPPHEDQRVGPNWPEREETAQRPGISLKQKRNTTPPWRSRTRPCKGRPAWAKGQERRGKRKGRGRGTRNGLAKDWGHLLLCASETAKEGGTSWGQVRAKEKKLRPFHRRPGRGAAPDLRYVSASRSGGLTLARPLHHDATALVVNRHQGGQLLPFEPNQKGGGRKMSSCAPAGGERPAAIGLRTEKGGRGQ